MRCPSASCATLAAIADQRPGSDSRAGRTSAQKASRSEAEAQLPICRKAESRIRCTISDKKAALIPPTAPRLQLTWEVTSARLLLSLLSRSSSSCCVRLC